MMRIVLAVLVLVSFAAVAEAQVAHPMPGATVNTAYSYTLPTTYKLTPVKWATSATRLPPKWLTFSLGTLSGTPTTAATHKFDMIGTLKGGGTVTFNCSLTVNGAIQMPITGTVAWTVNKAVSGKVFTVTGGTPKLTHSISGAAPGITWTFSSTGQTVTMGGTPTKAGTYTYAHTITDANGAKNSGKFSIRINSALALSKTNFPDATSGVAYTGTGPTASGGTTPYTYSTTASGVTINSKTGAISYAKVPTVTKPTTGTVPITVTDAAKATASWSASLTINPAPAITTVSPLTWTLGKVWSRSLTVSGGSKPHTWSYTGTLPTGLKLSSAGVLSGTPTATGSKTVSVTVTDANKATHTKSLTITINSGPSLPTVSLAWTASHAVSRTYSLKGGTSPIKWSVVAGKAGAAPGVTVAGSGSTLSITGTPTTAGTYTYSVTATDAAGAIATSTVTLTINAALKATGGKYPDAILNKAYSQTGVGKTGGTGSVTWKVVTPALPTWAKLTASDGTVTGTPTAAGTYSGTMQVTDSVGATATIAVTLTVKKVTIVLSPTSLPAWTTGRPYSQTLTATGGTTPYTFALKTGDTLPTGLLLNTTTGVIAGTPKATGTTSFTIIATDKNGSTGSRAYSVTINSAPSLSTASLTWTANHALNRSYTVKGGTAPFKWSVTAGASGPAPGVTVAGSGTTLSFTGTPTKAGTFTYSIKATDAAGGSASVSFTLTINAALKATGGTYPDAILNKAYSQTGVGKTGGTGSVTWKVVTPALPTWAKLTASDGTVSGTPTATGTYSGTMQVTDSVGATATIAVTLTVKKVTITLSPTSLPDWTAGKAYSQTLTSSGGTAPYSLGVTSGTLPKGLTLNPKTGALTGTPTTAGSSTFTVTATDANSSTGSRAFTVKINPAPSLSAVALTWTAGHPVSRTYALKGGTPTIKWSVVAGKAGAAPGVTVAGSGTTLSITGTPTTTGTYTYTATATDAAGAIATSTVTLTINAAMAMTGATYPDATSGQSYNQTGPTASGGVSPYTWTTVGLTLPTGIKLDGTTGAIAGTVPAVAKSTTYSGTIKVTDSVGASVTKSVSITINPALSVTTSSFPAWTVGKAYSASLAATGGTLPVAWSLSKGSLPTGLALNAATGAITGTPTAAGTFDFTVTVTDKNKVTASKVMSITINAVPTLSAISLTWTANHPVSRTYDLKGGTAPISWTVTPATSGGVTVSGSGTKLTVSGTPTKAGTLKFAVTATDAAKATASTTLSLTINGTLVATGGTYPDAVLNKAYSATGVGTSGGTAPFTWKVLSPALPTWAKLTAGDGTVSGTPTALGTWTGTMEVTDSVGETAKVSVSLTVRKVVLVITPSSLPEWTAGEAFSKTLTASGGATPYTWSHTGTLPKGLTLNKTTGVLSGTPSAAGKSTFTATVTDKNGATGSKAYTVTINAALSLPSAPDPDPWTEGQKYALSFDVAGGTLPLKASLGTGHPTGLAVVVVGRTVELTGTPAASGAFSFDITVDDAVGDDLAVPISLTLNPVPELTTTVLPDWTVLHPYAPVTLTHTGGTDPNSFEVSAGALPTGLGLDAKTGVVSGTPGAVGSYTFTLLVRDAVGATGTRKFAIEINEAVAIGTSTLDDWTVGVPFTKGFAGKGGTGALSWDVSSGTVTPGLSMSVAGTFSGTPTSAGKFLFFVRATDEVGATATVALSQTIRDPLSIGAGAFPDWTVGKAYSEAITGSGGIEPVQWDLLAGALPPGLSLGTAGYSASLDGTPTAPGTYHFSLRMTDDVGATVSEDFTLVIAEEPNVAGIPMYLAQSRPFSGALSLSGGTPPLKFGVTSGHLPSGLTLDPDTGVLSGKTSSVGTSEVEVSVMDGAGAESKVSLRVRVAPPLEIPAKWDATFAADQSYLYYVDLLEGTAVSLKLAYKTKKVALPTLNVLDGDGGPVSVADRLKSTSKSTSLKKWVVPASGRYFFEIDNTDAGYVGAMKGSLKVKPQSKWKATLNPTVGEEPGVLRIALLGGSDVKSIKIKVAGADFEFVGIRKPDGDMISESLYTAAAKGKSFTVKGVSINANKGQGGDYEILYRTSAPVQVKIAVRPPKFKSFGVAVKGAYDYTAP